MIRHILRYSTGLLILPLFIAGIITILHSKPSEAVVGSDWNAGNIIADGLFYDNTSMSVSDVQNFLNSKVPTCDTNGTQQNNINPSMTNAQYAASRGWPGPPYVCLKNYMQVPDSTQIIDNYSGSTPSGAISAAQIIKNAADNYSISPKAILVTLQKESLNLIYDTWPLQGQYKNAMGYGCPDSAPCNPSYAGFYNQINNAAYQFSLYRKNPTSYRYTPNQSNSIAYNPNSGCGSAPVNISNYATAGLYNYTPYQPNLAALNNLYGSGDSCSAYGNRNFWRVFNDWFGPTTGTKVIKSNDSDMIYVFSQGQKIPIPNLDIFNAYGFNKIGVTVVSSAYLASLPTGNPLTRISRYSDGTLQLIDQGKRFSIPSYDICTAWGLDCTTATSVDTLDNDIFTSSIWQGYLQPLMSYNGTIYKMSGGVKSPFLNMDALTQNGYSYNQISTITYPANASQPLGPLLPSIDTALKLTNGAIAIYTNNQLIAVNNPDVFYRWGLDRNYYTSLPASSWDTQPPAASATLSDTYIGYGNTKLLIDGGRKLDLTNVYSDWPSAPAANPYMSSLINRLSLVTVSPTSCFQSSSGDILRVENSSRRSIRLLSDIYLLGCQPQSLIPIADTSLSILSVGPAKLTTNRLFTVSGVPGIYMQTNEGSSTQLPTFDYVTAFGQQTKDIATVDNATVNYYTMTNNTSSVAGNSLLGTYFIYTATGTRFYLGSDTFSSWGFDKQTLPTYDTHIGTADATTSATAFARTPDGHIYYGSGGSHHLIVSYDAFIRLGGTQANTMNVLGDFINHTPNGININ